MRRVLLSEKSYKNLGKLTLVAGISVVLVIYPLLDFVDEDRRETMERDEQNHWDIRQWTQERENGYLLLAAAMTVGQLMVFIGLAMMVLGAVKSYMRGHLTPKAIQCATCQTWFDIKWPRCPKCDKSLLDALDPSKSRPHVIKVAIPTTVKRHG
jgi:hypothetical protein